jgi:hypothetical protein
MLPNLQLTQGLVASSHFPAVGSSTQYMTTDSSCPADFGHLLQSIGGNGRKGPPPALKGPKSQGGKNSITGLIKGDSPLRVIPRQEDEISTGTVGYDFECIISIVPTLQATTTSSSMTLQLPGRSPTAAFSLSREATKVDLREKNPMAYMNGFTVPACVAPHPVGIFSEAPGMQQYQQRTVVQCNTAKKEGPPSFVSQDADADDDASIESIDDIPKDYMDGLDVHVSLNALF